MTLNISERVWIPQLLFSQGSIGQLREAAEILSRTELSDEEKTAINYQVQPDGKISYDQEKGFEVIFEMSVSELVHLYVGTMDLDRRRMIDKTNITLVNKIYKALGIPA